MELLIACCEDNTEPVAKLGVSLIGLLQKAIFGSLSPSLDHGVQVSGSSIRDGRVFNMFATCFLEVSTC